MLGQDPSVQVLKLNSMTHLSQIVTRDSPPLFAALVEDSNVSCVSAGHAIFSLFSPLFDGDHVKLVLASDVTIMWDFRSCLPVQRRCCMVM